MLYSLLLSSPCSLSCSINNSSVFKFQNVLSPDLSCTPDLDVQLPAGLVSMSECSWTTQIIIYEAELVIFPSNVLCVLPCLVIRIIIRKLPLLISCFFSDTILGNRQPISFIAATLFSGVQRNFACDIESSLLFPSQVCLPPNFWF